MPEAKTTLLFCLGAVAVAFVLYWGWSIWRARGSGGPVVPTPFQLVVGFITDFLDTLGIGSFATTTSLYRARRTIDDRLLPGTLNVGHTIPTFVQALIYIPAIKVDSTTLILMIVAAVSGALLGAGIVARWPRRWIQLGMGMALIAVAAVIVFQLFWEKPTTGTLVLSGPLLALGCAGNFVLGALMTIGIGLYAPCLVLVSLLGMDASAAFPIMMGSCAFLMPLASVPFIRQGSYSPRAALGLTLAGVPAVLIAANLVVDLPLTPLKWLVAVVVIYTAIMLILAARTRGTARQ
jgi:uncharacterized membrane protein YfcA